MNAESAALIASLAALALGLGFWLVGQPGLLPLPASARFVIGATGAPHVIGLFILLWLFLFPGWSLRIPAVLLALGGLALLWMNRFQIYRLNRQIKRRHEQSWIRLTAWGTGLGLILVVGTIMFENARSPILAFDALQYAREALALEDARSLSGWVGHIGSADGSLRGDIHNPIFPAYLLWALQFCDWPGKHLPKDFPLRLAFQATLFAMLGALLLPGLAIGQRWFAVLVPALVLAVPGFDYISNSFSRDGFRIVPLVAWLAVMLRWGSLVPRHRHSNRLGLWCFLLSAFACASHTINLMALACASAGWGLWMLMLGNWQRVAGATVAVTAGALIGSITLVQAWMETGSIHGSGVLMYDAIRGGPLEYVVRQMELESLNGFETSISRAVHMLFRDGLGIAAAATLVAIAILVVSTFRQKIRHSAAFGSAWIALAVMGPSLGLFDLLGYPVSEWFVTNLRYLLHWYPFLAVVLMTGVALVIGWSTFDWRKGTLVVSAALTCYLFTLRNWPVNHWGPEMVLAYIQDLQQAATVVAPKRLLMEDARWNYYLGNRHAVMFSKPTAALLIPREPEQIRAALATMQIGGVVLVSSSVPKIWQFSPLYQLLACESESRVRNKCFTLFLIEIEAPDEDR